MAVGGVVPGDHPGAHRGRHRVQSDGLIGLKENIIIGKLIPAGTGMPSYREIATYAPDYQPMEYYSMADEEQDLAEWLAGKADLNRADEAGAEVIDLPTSGGAAG